MLLKGPVKIFVTSVVGITSVGNCAGPDPLKYNLGFTILTPPKSKPPILSLTNGCLKSPPPAFAIAPANVFGNELF